MIVKSIIKGPSAIEKFLPEGERDFLNISEFFFDTIQGEGINIGHPAAFLRLKGCTQNCTWCDSKEVWRFGDPYTFDELIKYIEDSGLAFKLQKGQHLVLTGGSPLLQQNRLKNFLPFLIADLGFKPYIEIENECVLKPDPVLVGLIDCWNNSPKLSNSEVPFERRYKPQVIQYTASLPNSWFKFVVSNDDDWNEIETGFLLPGLIKRNQIILMPQGATRAELELNQSIVVDMAIEYGVRYSSREHVAIWDKATGI